MFRTIAAASLAAAALTVSGVTIAGATTTTATTAAPAVPSKAPAWMTRPCPEEDSANCYWDAQSAGNGVGHSFYSIRAGGKLCTIFWQGAYGRKHNECVKDDER